MFIDDSQGTRIIHMRTEQFLSTGAQTIGVSCPFCLQMMEEGIDSKGVSGTKKARDILELLADSVEP